MLTILRKHKSNIIVKVIFAFIIISFAAFFGSGGLRSKSKDIMSEGDSPAFVNGHAISQTRFSSEYDQQMEKLRGMFKDQVPKEFEQNIKKSVINNLVNQELIIQETANLGLKTSPVELADSIKNNDQFQQNGSFSLDFYKYKFLPWYAQTTGASYEHDMMNDLAIQKFLSVFDSALTANPQELIRANIINQTKFKFAVVTIPAITPPQEDNKNDKANKDKATQDVNNLSGEEKAKKLMDLWKSGKIKKDTLDKYGLAQRDTPDLSYTDLKNVFGGNASLDNLKKIAGLTKDKSYTDAYLQEGNNFYLVKLVDFKKADEKLTAETEQGLKDQYQREQANGLQASYIEQLRDKAKIKLHSSLQ